MEQFRKGVLTHPCQCPSGRRYRRSTQPSLCCGTATILKEYVDSTKDPDSTAPRIFWLQNQDAKGRSPVATTIAPHARNRGQLGSCFCFSRERQAERLHEKLLPNNRTRLCSSRHQTEANFGGCTCCRFISWKCARRGDITQQWKMFIGQPKRSHSWECRHCIGALDESGSDTSRKHILRYLGSAEAAKLPNLRILLTSRPEADIWRGVKHRQANFISVGQN